MTTPIDALGHAGRTAVFSALFARLEALQSAQRPAPPDRPFVTVSRVLKHWTNISANQCPALFLAIGRQSAVSMPKLPTKWVWHADLHVYVKTEERAGVAAAEHLDALLDAVEAVFAPDYDGECTLGGLVTRCRIAGDIETDEGVLGSTAVASIPVEILPLR